MDTGTYAVVTALLAGTVRAVLLWRASTSVEVVNVAVLAALAEGRGASLEKLLRGSGSALYLDVAGAIGRAALELPSTGDTGRDLRAHLEHAARKAIQGAGRALRRHAWLDYLALIAICYAGIDAVLRSNATAFNAVALVAASLLWLANLRSARHIATRVYAGATMLIEGVLASFEQLQKVASETLGNHAGQTRDGVGRAGG